MKAVSGTLMRSIEASAIQRDLADSWAMMSRAGKALARESAAFSGRGTSSPTNRPSRAGWRMPRRNA